MIGIQQYPLGWRVLHWLIGVLVLILIPVGLWMASRSGAGLDNALTDNLYAWHKAIGFAVLLLMLVRVVVRLRLRPPPYPASMSARLQAVAKGSHHLMYVLLLVVPLLGWAGVSAYPALDTLGGYNLPAMPWVPHDADLGGTLFTLHAALAILLAVLVIGHIGAAIRHMLRKDGIIRRMI